MVTVGCVKTNHGTFDMEFSRRVVVNNILVWELSLRENSLKVHFARETKLFFFT